jgi:penicillin-binding protein 1C
MEYRRRPETEKPAVDSRKKKKRIWRWVIRIVAVFIALCFIAGGVLVLWVASLQLPDINTIESRALSGSTKIYDRNDTLLYDLNQNAKQQIVPFDQISPWLKDATVAIEDENFYKNHGIEISSIARALYVDIANLSFKQGGSTITQQVVKNTLLSDDKSITRKIKEWILAIKLDGSMSKDDILNLYLNSSPYGSDYYGVEEASQNYFGTSSANLDIAQSAYIAAMPQAPTYYSPYGLNITQLNSRKNLVLQKMESNGYITSDQYQQALAEKVTFQPQQTVGIKAPHFVMFIINYLIQKYGQDVVDNDGLKVTTTLDYGLEQKAEQIVNQYALSNVQKYNATNAGLVAIDPNTGQILAMVGSRNYFDTSIDGQFNVTTAYRQPGSTFKPFAYVTAFEKGYTPDTVVFDVPTQFSTSCDWQGNPIPPNVGTSTCYMPQNYDNKFLGPISFRNALDQSINIPSIKVLYLAGIDDTLQTAQDMGITSLAGADRYGLTLVLGGGEVSLLEMTSAYGDFATNGVRNPYTGILEVDDKSGNVLEKYQPDPTQVLPLQPVLELNDVLHDNNARLPLNGPGSATDFPNREVALKTGTTNDYRDAWTIGYTPQIVVGAWAGNNDDTPMSHQISGLIVAPLWRVFMNDVLANLPPVTFQRPAPIDPNLKPILRGIWQGNQVYTIDTISGDLATDFTPAADKKEVAVPNIHSILYWVDKNNPTGPPPANPSNDPQFNLWEPAVQAWVATHGSQLQLSPSVPPTQTDPIHTPDAIPVVSITTPSTGADFNLTSSVRVTINYQSKFPLAKADLYFNNTLVDTQTTAPFSFLFKIANIESSTTQTQDSITVDVSDIYGNSNQASTTITIN